MKNATETQRAQRYSHELFSESVSHNVIEIYFH